MACVNRWLGDLFSCLVIYNNENVLNNIKIAKKRFIILPNTKMVQHFGQSNNSTYLIIIYNFLVILTRDGT